MKANIVAACIIALALIVAVALNGGLYQTQKANDDNSAVWRTNKVTGAVSICTIRLGCHPLAEGFTIPRATPVAQATSDFMTGAVPVKPQAVPKDFVPDTPVPTK